MVNIISVTPKDNIDGWLLFGHKISRRHRRHVVVVCFLLMGDVVPVVQDSA
jgi:hypothetical protein